MAPSVSSDNEKADIQRVEDQNHSNIRASPASPDFPEGSPRGWATLLGASLVAFATSGYTFSFGVYQDFYIRVFLSNYSPSEIGWIGSIQIWLLFALGIVTGPAFDRGYFYHLMIAGMLLQALSYYMLSLCHENKYYQVFLAHLGGAIAHGLVYVPSIGIVAHYFQKHRSLAMGCVAAGVAFGGVVHTILLNHLLNGPIGFANGVRISQSLNFALFFLAILIMRTRLPPQSKKLSFPVIQYMKDPPFLLLVVGMSILIIGLFLPIFYLQLFAIQKGLNEEIVFYSLAVMNGVSVVGRTLPSYYAPRLGTYNLGTLCTILCGISAICMPLIVNLAGVMVYAGVYGFLSGATISLGYPMFAMLAKDVSELGSRIGIGFCTIGFVGLASAPILGAVLTSKFYWWHASILSGVTIVTSGIINGAARWFIARRKGSPWV